MVRIVEDLSFTNDKQMVLECIGNIVNELNLLISIIENISYDTVMTDII